MTELINLLLEAIWWLLMLALSLKEVLFTLFIIVLVLHAAEPAFRRWQTNAAIVVDNIPGDEEHDPENSA